MATSATVTLPTLAAIPWLRYCVTMRDDARPLGGDMSFSTGATDPQGIIENRTHALASIGRTPDQAVMSGLVHRTTVRSVGWDDAGRGALIPTTVIPQTDGLLTDESGLTLMMCFADCVPLIVVDTERRVIALAHAGWRGTLAGMACSVVTAMRERHGSMPENLTALIGPSIGPRVYAVGPEVVSAFT
ncbi:MAG: polyphenol oxidase family protein, partial [Chloroflexota bacterium]|nr:polyphenol oxidase family protein [Chloroflexota bacterium]